MKVRFEAEARIARVNEFYADSTDIIPELGVVLRGTTTHSESLFALLHDRYGRILTHP